MNEEIEGTTKANEKVRSSTEGRRSQIPIVPGRFLWFDQG